MPVGLISTNLTNKNSVDANVHLGCQFIIHVPYKNGMIHTPLFIIDTF